MTRKLLKFFFVLALVFNLSLANAEEFELSPVHTNDFYFESLVVEKFQTPPPLQPAEFRGCELVDEFFDHQLESPESAFRDCVEVERYLQWVASLESWIATFDWNLADHLLAPAPVVDVSAPVGLETLAFDIEKAIEDSWLELEFGIAPAALPDHSTPKSLVKVAGPMGGRSIMDRYWTYYDDCDRWDVVFQSYPETTTSVSWWTVVSELELAKAPQMMADEILLFGKKIGDGIEFIRTEDAFPIATRMDWMNYQVLGPQTIEIANINFVIRNWSPPHLNPVQFSRDYLLSVIARFSDTSLVKTVFKQLKAEHQRSEIEKAGFRSFLNPQLEWLGLSF